MNIREQFRIQHFCKDLNEYLQVFSHIKHKRQIKYECYLVFKSNSNSNLNTANSLEFEYHIFHFHHRCPCYLVFTRPMKICVITNIRKNMTIYANIHKNIRECKQRTFSWNSNLNGKKY